MNRVIIHAFMSTCISRPPSPADVALDCYGMREVAFLLWSGIYVLGRERLSRPVGTRQSVTEHPPTADGTVPKCMRKTAG